MKIHSAVPWQTQLRIKQQEKQGKATGQEDKTQQAAWRKETAFSKNASWQQTGIFSAKPAWMNLLGGAQSLALQELGIGKETSARQAGEIDPEQEAINTQVGSAFLKMKMGHPLSDNEMKLLAKHAPELYKKAVQIKQEREQYRKELEQCQSKEDVQKVRERKFMQFSAEVSAIQHSSMSKADKMAAMEFIAMRMTNVENEMQSFMATSRYQRLPEKRKEKDQVVLPAEPDKKALKEMEDFYKKQKQSAYDASKAALDKAWEEVTQSTPNTDTFAPFSPSFVEDGTAVDTDTTAVSEMEATTAQPASARPSAAPAPEATAAPTPAQSHAPAPALSTRA